LERAAQFRAGKRDRNCATSRPGRSAISISSSPYAPLPQNAKSFDTHAYREPTIRYSYMGQTFRTKLHSPRIDRWPITGFLIAKDDRILVEPYQYVVTRDGDKLRARPMSAYLHRDENAIYLLTDVPRHKDNEIATPP
jgi:hypothetical protein